jgi:hypothetical protein
MRYAAQAVVPAAVGAGTILATVMDWQDPEPIPQLRNAMASNNLRIFVSSFLCSHLADVHVWPMPLRANGGVAGQDVDT